MSPAQLQLAEALVLSSPKRAALEVERYPAQDVAEFLAQLSPEAAARLLRTLVPVASSCALNLMDPEVAAPLLECLGPQRAVVLLGRMDKDARSRVREALTDQTRVALDRMLEYRPDQAGYRLDPKAPAVSLGATASHALELIGQAGESALHYIYVVDPEHRLVGVVSMRELMLVSPATLVDSAMTPSPERLLSSAQLASVVVHPGWRLAHALPVVDSQGRFLGALRYSAFRSIETELGQAQSGPRVANTSEALAELLWLGTSAMAKMTGAAFLGGVNDEEKS